MVVLFIFRRDLRVHDNVGLREASRYAKQNNDKLLVSFVFTKDQTINNNYYSDKAFRFLLLCLENLKNDIDITFFENNDFYKQIPDLRAIMFNRDYTPYARRRDADIERFCLKNNIHFKTFEDYTLHGIQDIKNQKRKPYQVFGPFYKKAKTLKVPKENPKQERNPLRKQAFSLLKKNIDYKTFRDFPAKDATSRIGPYLKFGVVSVREVYHRMRNNREFVKQLYWREFYANVAYHFPHVLAGMLPGKKSLEMYPKFRNLSWRNNKQDFQRWCQGKTGVPIVDAGMRQLNKTGFMNNRLRMITASFLVKNLEIDWRWGERYFATKLIDYDPASNNGGWQWVAGTGTDASPYFRVFNPWTQAERFDKNATFIKKYVPELRSLSTKEIHNWENNPNPQVYLAPMIKHNPTKIKQFYLKSFKVK